MVFFSVFPEDLYFVTDARVKSGGPYPVLLNHIELKAVFYWLCPTSQKQKIQNYFAFPGGFGTSTIHMCYKEAVVRYRQEPIEDGTLLYSVDTNFKKKKMQKRREKSKCTYLHILCTFYTS